MTPAQITNFGNLSSALSALLTAYIAVRSIFIWNRYLTRVAGDGNVNVTRAFFRKRMADSPPTRFATWDLTAATTLLALTCLAGVVFYAIGVARS